MRIDDFSIITWLYNNQIKVETGDPLDLKDHLYLFDIYRDFTPKQVVMKSAQIGFTTLAILKSLWVCKNKRMDAIYTMPSDSDVQILAGGKVSRIVEQNPVLKQWVQDKDTVQQKRVGDNIIYYRGTWTSQAALSVSADLLIHDEEDRCFLPGVEVLTRKGWKKIEEITKKDKIATRTKDSRVTFKYPKEIVSINYDGEVYRLEGNGFGLSVTPKHRLFARVADHHFVGFSDRYKLQEVRDLYGQPFVLTGSARWNYAGKKETVSIPNQLVWRRKQGSSTLPRMREYRKAKSYPAVAFYRFLGWYLSEGSVTRVNGRATGGICITQKDDRQTADIESIIRELGYEPRTYTKEINGVHNVVFRDLQLASYLQSLGKSEKKYIPDRYLWGNPKYLKELLATFQKGDGDERGVLTTSSKKLADTLYIAILRCGFNCNYYYQKNDTLGVYRVKILKQKYRRFNGYRKSNTKATVKKEKYKGKVYCLSVENETFLVRSSNEKRKGIAIWSGNSKQAIIAQYASRLQHSKYQWEWHFSNPSVEGNGVSRYWGQSDQKHWFISCRACKDLQFLGWPESIDQERRAFVCKKCGKELTRDDRRKGRWVKKWRYGKEWSGYWIPLFVNPAITVEKILEYYETKSPEYFSNFVLGQPYVGEGNKVDPDDIFKNCTSTVNSQESVVIGVDVGLTKHFVVGNAEGIFYYGKTKDWEYIERLLMKFPRSIAVFDALPDLTRPRELKEKYPGRVWLCTFGRDKKTMQFVRWGEKKEYGNVVADRNRMIQLVVDEFKSGRIPLQGKREEWQEYYTHWAVMYRVNLWEEAKEKGNENYMYSAPYRWDSATDMQHWVFATTYWRVGMDRFGRGKARIFSGEQNPLAGIPSAPTIGQRNVLPNPMKQSQEQEHDWRI